MRNDRGWQRLCWPVGRLLLCACLVLPCGAAAGQSTQPGTAPASQPATMAALSDADRALCAELGLDPEQVASLQAKPLYAFNEAEVDVYLRFLHASTPDLRDRVGHLARKNLGQPYELYLLGEAPFEVYDPQPIYCLDRSDCVVFAEHTYAMALSWDWPTFIAVLQRIRYAEGQIGVVTRNHYTEADWNPSNQWLVQDLSPRLPRRFTDTYRLKVDRARFFAQRYGLNTAHEVEELEVSYVPIERVMDMAGRLEEGDFVNFVYGQASVAGGDPACWVGHVGLIVIEDGKPHLLHSTPPKVKIEPLEGYVAGVLASMDARDAAGKRRTFGLKFHRLADDPWANLRAIDGPSAPRVVAPGPFAAPGFAPESAQARR
ncbi:MAG: N-acetylmuramoyl-L-alanine amidase-like domain-containing protein [Planctomycetota bacterium]